MTDFCYYADNETNAKTLADAMKSKHGCECAVLKSTRLINAYYVIPASNANKWKIKYGTVYRTDSQALGN